MITILDNLIDNIPINEEGIQISKVISEIIRILNK